MVSAGVTGVGRRQGARVVGQVAASVVAAGVAGVGYAWLEARHFALRRVSVPVLAPGSRPIEVLHLSDLHLVPRQRRKHAWLRSLGELRPDLVISTGDHWAAHGALDAVLDAHGPLLERPGVFVFGSNDYYAPRLKNPARYLLKGGGDKRIHGERLPTDDLSAAFASAGWVDLTHRRTTLEVAGVAVEFVGVDDAHLGLDRYHLVSGPPSPDAALSVGVTHAPYRRVLDAMVADGLPLVIAGHTHGGQLCLPGIGALVTNCDLPRRQAKGLSTWTAPLASSGDSEGAAASGGSGTSGDSGGAASGWLHVSAGMGTSPFTPVRFACRPEATLVTLTAGH